MAKFKFESKALFNRVFDDLENFLTFCRDYGYRFDEANMYNFKAYPWQQYNKFINGKNAKNMWEEDSRKFGGYRPRAK